MAHTPIDSLVDGSRIKGASRIIADGAVVESISEDQRNSVCQSILNYMGQAGMSRSAVARSIGISPTTLGLVLNGNYGGNWKQLTIDLDLWLEIQTRRDAAPKPSSFVWTRVAREIRAVADVAQTLKTIGLVYGPESAGFGKTTTLAAIAASKPGSVVVALGKMDTTAPALIRAIAWAMKITCGNSARVRYQLIKERLAETSRMLLIDQIHVLCGVHPTDKPLYILADLFDATGAPQLWCGTSDVVSYLHRRQTGNDSLAQIRRRIGIARDLCDRTRSDDGGPGEPLYTLEEIQKVLAQGKMRITPDAARYLLVLANTADSGALGAVCNLVAMATVIYERTETALTAGMLRTAHRMLVSRTKFTAVEDSMHEPRAQQRTG